MEDEIKDIAFAERLVKLRVNLPLRDAKVVAIKDVAEEAGVNVGSYSRAENGIIPGEKVLNRLAKYYGVPMNYLLHGDDKQRNGYATDPPPPMPALDRDGLFGQTRRVKVDGKEFSVTSHSPAQDNPYLQPMAMLTEILASGDPVLVPAIQANLRAFQTAIHKERKLTEYSQKLNDLQNKYEDVKKENTNLEERLAALERRLDEVASGKCPPQDRNEPESDQPDPGKRAVA